MSTAELEMGSELDSVPVARRERPRYAAYRDSGVEWLGEVPDHWEVSPLGYHVRLLGGATPDKSRTDFWDGPVPWVSPKDMKREIIADSEDHVSAEAVAGTALSMIPVGSVLIVVRGMILAHSFPVALTAAPLTINQDMKALAPHRTLDPQFLAWMLRGAARVLVASADESAHGTRKLETAVLTKLPVPIPPLVEQQAIASFLESRTATVDLLMKKKAALITRLQEKRRALISRVVTRGLPPEAARAAGLQPHTEYSPGGVEWLGKVPVSWEVGNLRRFAQMKTGHTPSRQESEYWEDCTIPWFTLADVWQLRDGQTIYLGETKEKISELGLANSAAELLPTGTVVLSRTASVGYSGIMPRPMATSQDFWNWVCGPKLVPEFLLHVFRAMAQEFERSTMGSTHKTIYQADAAAIAVPCPPPAEQRAIAEYLERETGILDHLVGRIQTAVARLREYRTALITAAVTGKIDVRGES